MAKVTIASLNARIAQLERDLEYKEKLLNDREFYISEVLARIPEHLELKGELMEQVEQLVKLLPARRTTTATWKESLLGKGFSPRGVEYLEGQLQLHPHHQYWRLSGDPAIIGRMCEKARELGMKFWTGTENGKRFFKWEK